jgi:hypothetical protein
LFSYNTFTKLHAKILVRFANETGEDSPNPWVMVKPTFSAVLAEQLDGKTLKLKKAAEVLQAVVKKRVPRVKETVNAWHVPLFESNGPMLYLSVAARHISVGFVRGTLLKDPSGLLEGTGELRHVKVRNAEDAENPALAKLIEAAAAQNRRKPARASSIENA